MVTSTDNPSPLLNVAGEGKLSNKVPGGPVQMYVPAPLTG